MTEECKGGSCVQNRRYHESLFRLKSTLQAVALKHSRENRRLRSTAAILNTASFFTLKVISLLMHSSTVNKNGIGMTTAKQFFIKLFVAQYLRSIAETYPIVLNYLFVGSTSSFRNI